MLLVSVQVRAAFKRKIDQSSKSKSRHSLSKVHDISVDKIDKERLQHPRLAWIKGKLLGGNKGRTKTQVASPHGMSSKTIVESLSKLV